MSSVFLSYRRDDSLDETRQLKVALEPHFGVDLVFRDEESIPKGIDFRESLNAELASCQLMLVVIGDRWLSAIDDCGIRRIDDPHDFVHLEIAAALKRNIPIVPVLIRGATIPGPRELPEPLTELSFRNAITLSDLGDSNAPPSRLVEDLVAHILSKDKVMYQQGSRMVCPANGILTSDVEGWSLELCDEPGEWLLLVAMVIMGFVLFPFVNSVGNLVLRNVKPYVRLDEGVLAIVVFGIQIGMLLLSLTLAAKIFLSRTFVRVRAGRAFVAEGSRWLRRLRDNSREEFPWNLARVEPRSRQVAIVIAMSADPKVERELCIGARLSDASRLFLYWYLWNQTTRAKQASVNAPISGDIKDRASNKSTG